MSALLPLSRDAEPAAPAAAAKLIPPPWCRYLPISTPYSRRLAVLLDSLQAGPGGRVDRAGLAASLQKMGYRVDQAEAQELFDVVDVNK